MVQRSICWMQNEVPHGQEERRRKRNLRFGATERLDWMTQPPNFIHRLDFTVSLESFDAGLYGFPARVSVSVSELRKLLLSTRAARSGWQVLDKSVRVVSERIGKILGKCQFGNSYSFSHSVLWPLLTGEVRSCLCSETAF